MSDQTVDRSSKQDGETQSLAELFHLVKTLVPGDQHVLHVPPNTTVAEAVRKMQEHNYSQLPVVAGNQVLGVFSFRSLATGVLSRGKITQAVSIEELPVAEFMEHYDFAQPSDQWERIIEQLDRDNAVLVGQREDLRGILTPMDVLNYLHRITSPFVMIAEIELSLRRIIKACVSDEELKVCAQTALATKYRPPSELPTELDKMTFNDYVSIITDRRNWAHFAEVFFGEGARADWTRKDVNGRLIQVRDLRNKVFHFRSSLSEEEMRALRDTRDWLQIRTSAFEATRAAPPLEKKPFTPPRRKWDELSFFAELEKKRGSQAVDAAKRILAWARQKGARVVWGAGKHTGSFKVVVRHKGKDHHLFFVSTTGDLSAFFPSYKPPFDSEARKLELVRRLNSVEGVSLGNDVVAGYFPISPDVLENKATLQQVLSVFEWAIEEIKRA